MRVSILERLRLALRREKADIGEAWRDAEARLDADLDRREGALTASPEEKLAQVQSEIDADENALDEIRRKIEGRAEHEP